MPYVFQCTGRENLAMMLASSTKYRREEEPKKAKKKQEQNMKKNQKTREMEKQSGKTQHQKH